MPLFEFECTECAQPFEELVLNSSRVEEVICPDCGSSHVRKKISTFASKIAGNGAFSLNTGAGASCNTGST